MSCLQVRELSSSLATAQQQLAGAQSAQAADAAAAEQRLKLLQQQLATAEAGLMRRMTGGWFMHWFRVLQLRFGTQAVAVDRHALLLVQ